MKAIYKFLLVDREGYFSLFLILLVFKKVLPIKITIINNIQSAARYKLKYERWEASKNNRIWSMYNCNVELNYSIHSQPSQTDRENKQFKMLQLWANNSAHLTKQTHTIMLLVLIAPTSYSNCLWLQYVLEKLFYPWYLVFWCLIIIFNSQHEHFQSLYDTYNVKAGHLRWWTFHDELYSNIQHWCQRGSAATPPRGSSSPAAVAPSRACTAPGNAPPGLRCAPH